jgi:hypothetical protein
VFSLEDKRGSWRLMVHPNGVSLDRVWITPSDPLLDGLSQLVNKMLLFGAAHPMADTSH